jgi:anti-sigma factor RsiW
VSVPAHLLSRWLDGRCNPAEQAHVERLLASDAEAAAYVRRLREAGEALRSSASREPAPDLAERVLAAAALPGGELAAFRRAARRYVAAASVLLGMGLGGSVWIDRTGGTAAASPPVPGLVADPADARIEEMVLSDLDGAPARGPEPEGTDR